MAPYGEDDAILWNVPGLRAGAAGEFLAFADVPKPDILCVQAVRASQAAPGGTGAGCGVPCGPIPGRTQGLVAPHPLLFYPRTCDYPLIMNDRATGGGG
jgi:hypothetical protein